MCLLVSHSSVADGFTIPPKAKNLLQILVEELPKIGGWPEGVKWLAQTPGGSILGREIYQSGPHFSLVLDTVADDYRTAKVMRDQYEAALADTATTDGWIEWAGGECPVDGAAFVDYKMRSGQVGTDDAHILRWNHKGFSGDIIAYRLHQPQDATSRANDERLEADLNDCIGQAPGAPQWDGQGLPPVGCECEVKSPRHGWTKAIVTAVTDNWLIAQYPDGAEFAKVHRIFEDDGTFTNNYDGFRAIRSEAELKREAEIAALAEAIDACDEGSDLSSRQQDSIAQQLYAAGYRKQ